MSLDIRFDKKNSRLYKEFKRKNYTILPLAETESWIWVFSTFLILLHISLIFDQLLKAIPVLKFSDPQLSDGCIYFPFTFVFMYARKHFTFFSLLCLDIFGILDNNFEIFITDLIFHQIQLSRTVLNAELHQR